MVNIALDGPSGSGKSTIAKAISKEMNILYLDTGAMYRSFAYFCLINKTDIDNEQELAKLLQSFDLKVIYSNGEQKNYVNNELVNDKIRINEVSNIASKTSVFQCVRDFMLKMQREIAKSSDCVLDGRDIGTKILPNCKNKFYITASVDTRAERRYKELILKGQEVSLNQIKTEIAERDYRDTHREISPLKQADDAIYVDTTNMTIEQVVKFVIDKVKENVL